MRLFRLELKRILKSRRTLISVSYTHLDVYKRQVFRRRKIGFVFQAFNLVSSGNVWENSVLPLGLDGRKVDEVYVLSLIHI